MHIKKIGFLLLLLPLLRAPAQNQGQQHTDSMVAALQTQRSDTARVKLLNTIGLYYLNVNQDSAGKYARIGMALADSMHWIKGISAFHTIYGSILTDQGKLDAALQEYLQALRMSTKINDSANISGAYTNLGAVANAKSDFVAAANYYNAAKTIGEALNNYYSIAVACEDLALVYQYQQDYSKGLYYAKEAYANYKKIGDETGYVSALGMMGDLFLRAKKEDTAFFYYNRALFFAHKTGDALKEGAILNSLADYYARRKDYASAIRLALQGKSIFDRVGPAFEDAINNKGILGSYYLEQSKEWHGKNADSVRRLLNLSKSNLEEAVRASRMLGNRNSQAEFQQSLAEVDALFGDYRGAYENISAYTTLSDSIYSQDNKNKIAALETRHEIDKKNQEIENQKRQVREQKKNAWLLLVGLLLTAAIGLLFVRLSAIRQRQNRVLAELNKKLDEANKVKARFFGILSHDLRSPISNHVNFLRLQQEGKTGLTAAEQADQETRIRSASFSLLDAMEDLLLWSKGQMENFQPENRHVPVDALFGHLRQFFVNTTGIYFEYACEPGLQLFTDENYLKTIMRNLTQNAVNALRQFPGGKICWKAWAEEGKTWLSITDNGGGLDMVHLKNLEDGAAVTSSRQGLGLHIIRDMAEAIHCHIIADAGAGGSTFLLRV